MSYQIRFNGLETQEIFIPEFTISSYLEFLIIFSLIWILCLFASGLYSDRHTSLFFLNSRLIFKGSMYVFLGIGLFSYLAKAEFSRSIFITYFLLGVIFLLIERQIVNVLFLKPLRVKRRLTTSLLVIGLNSKDLDKYTDWLVENQGLGFKVTKRLLCPQIDFDWIQRFDSVIREVKLDEILLLPGMDIDQNFSKFIHYIQDLNFPISWIPHDSGNLGYWQVPHPQEGLPFLTFKDSKIHTIGLLSKRIFDILFSISALVLLMPAFVTVALLILLREGRPVFFAQKRVGKNGKLFRMYKFRTMVTNAENMISNVSNQHGSGHVLFKNQKDPRITKTGAFLRRYSIDELPQFFNSLLGSISVVGPRPALPDEAKIYSSLYERRLMVKPGITGPWQISGRSELDLQTSIALDLNYVINWSFTRDMAIILSTISAVFRKTGAY